MWNPIGITPKLIVKSIRLTVTLEQGRLLKEGPSIFWRAAVYSGDHAVNVTATLPVENLKNICRFSFIVSLFCSSAYFLMDFVNTIRDSF